MQINVRENRSGNQ